MKTIGVVKSNKSGEDRRAIIPIDLKLNKYNDYIYIEKGYGEIIGISDKEYIDVGCHVVERKEAFQCDVILDVKVGDADYLESVHDGKILFGWAHAVQNQTFTSCCIEHGHSVIAWEEMFEDGRYMFYRNREIAGEAAIMHGLRFSKQMPYSCKVAILGNGQTAKGAMRVLHGLGAEVDVFNRKLENLFKKKMFDYDVIVNCVMWDTNRTDRIIYKSDLKKFKRGTLIIDVSCDPNLEIETSHPTTIEKPIYEVDGVIHYAVDNTPAMFPKTVTGIISEKISCYLDHIISENIACYPECLKHAIVIKDGEILDDRISQFRKRMIGE